MAKKYLLWHEIFSYNFKVLSEDMNIKTITLASYVYYKTKKKRYYKG